MYWRPITVIFSALPFGGASGRCWRTAGVLFAQHVAVGAGVRWVLNRRQLDEREHRQPHQISAAALVQPISRRCCGDLRATVPCACGTDERVQQPPSTATKMISAITRMIL